MISNGKQIILVRRFEDVICRDCMKKEKGEIIEVIRKKALVTGASRGIGKAIAKMLAAQKYDLYLTCRKSSNQLEALGKSLRQQYGIN